METIHLMQAVHAAKEGDKNGCKAKGTKRVELDEGKVTCRCCRRWYWHHEGLVAAPHVLKEVLPAVYEQKVHSA